MQQPRVSSRSDQGSIVLLGELLTSLSTLEGAASANALPPSFDREIERVSTAISEQVERLKGIRMRQAALTKQSQAARDRQYAQM